MKLSLNLKSGTAAIHKLKDNFSLGLWVFLFIIAVLTGLVIFKEVRKVSQVQTDTSGLWDKIVRVNLSLHKNLETRLSENSSFQPQTVPGVKAFSAAPVKVSQ